MRNTKIFTVTSPLHDEQAVSAVTEAFLESLHLEFDFKGSDFSHYGEGGLDLIYVRTGGTEGVFRQLLPKLTNQSCQPFYLLTSGKSNSLAASMEILSYLRQHGLAGEIIHGKPEYVSQRIRLLAKVEDVRTVLRGCRLGVVGQPSDWLISSEADKGKVKEKLGVELVDIPMEELLEIIKGIPEKPANITCEEECVRLSIPGAERIHQALEILVGRHKLQGFTLRCFDLLSVVHNTGCLALARLNADGVIAGCEGDVPAMLSMCIARAVCGVSGFQANPATIDPETGEILFAHCTIPLDMVERYEFDTHFESGIGIGIRGYMKEGPVTIFKVSGDLSRHFVAEGWLERNLAEPDLCRTQQVIRLADKSLTEYFLKRPIGNHHIILPGHHKEILELLM